MPSVCGLGPQVTPVRPGGPCGYASSRLECDLAGHMHFSVTLSIMLTQIMASQKNDRDGRSKTPHFALPPPGFCAPTGHPARLWVAWGMPPEALGGFAPRHCSRRAKNRPKLGGCPGPRAGSRVSLCGTSGRQHGGGERPPKHIHARVVSSS